MRAYVAVAFVATSLAVLLLATHSAAQAPAARDEDSASTAPADAESPPSSESAATAATRRVLVLCRRCHANKFAAASHNPHSVLEEDRWREDTDNTPGCVNCHGDVTEHVRRGGGRREVFAFRTEPAVARNDRCLVCHATTHPEFARSPHALAGLSCTNCHSMHGDGAQPNAALLRMSMSPSMPPNDHEGTTVCFDCHAEQFNEFAFTERHRLREGSLDCTSCHDPHEPASRSQLGGFKQQACIGCHTDKGGPFIFEHPVSRVEGCTACHAPHGSPNRHLLSFQRVGELCLSCHAEVPQFHTGFSPVGPPRFDLDTQCTNCHTSIHGSNFERHFLR